MNNPNISEELADKRQYIRLPSAFPVEFTIVRLQGDLPGIDWQLGHTSNVSQGGMCLETAELSETVIQYLQRQNILLELRVRVPFGGPPVKAVAEVAWYRKVGEEMPRSYIVGLKFKSIIAKDLDRILGRAKWLQFWKWKF